MHSLHSSPAHMPLPTASTKDTSTSQKQIVIRHTLTAGRDALSDFQVTGHGMMPSDLIYRQDLAPREDLTSDVSDLMASFMARARS